MNKTVRFFPNSKKHKSVLGAVKVNEPVKFTLEFSRPQNPQEVYLVLTKDNENPVSYPMKQIAISNEMMTYTVEISVTSRGLYFYYFAVLTEDYQIRFGADNDLNALYNKGQNWQLTVFERDYQNPQWLKGGMIYQIMPDRFNIGGERQKTKKTSIYRNDWNGCPEYRPDKNGKILNNDVFGGNLKGITKKLAYLKGLGVSCIYLNPIFKARSNHKYDTGNYLKIDEDLGSEDDLKELIKKADKKGIKIVLDGVFSHTGDDSIYFNKYGSYDSLGAYQSKDSPYSSWYTFSEHPNKYDSWWGIDILPNVNENNPSYNEFISGEEGVVRKWTRLGLGGWRFDVADELPDKFLDNCIRAIKSCKADALVLGEVWEDASNKISYSVRRKYLLGSQLDSVTNYPLKEDILNYVRCGDAQKLNNTLNILINNYPKDILDSLMNLLDTHDTARVLTVLGDSGKIVTRDDKATAQILNLEHAIRLLKLASVLQYTLPGVPCVYYGDEAGLEGFEDPFNRRCYPWDNQNKEILRWYRRLGKMRSDEQEILKDGHYIPLLTDEGIMMFKRANAAGELIVIVNNSAQIFIPELDGTYIDTITQKPFKGTLKDKECVVLKKAEINQ